jgi:hypothetical protein
MTDDPYSKSYPSPSRAYVVRTEANEMANSRWVDSAALVDASGRVLLAFGLLWQADVVRWIDDARVALELRHYPGDRSVSLEVDVARREVLVFGAPQRTWSFEETARWLANPA